MLKHLTQKNKNSKPNSESKCRKSRFKKQTHNLNQKNQDSKPNSESKSENQDSEIKLTI
nr:hypothetical protein [Mycoplasmopsis bovis]